MGRIGERMARMALMSDRDCWTLHGANVVGGTALFVLFWVTLPEWIRVPYGVFYGAAMMNSIIGVVAHRDARALELEQESGLICALCCTRQATVDMCPQCAGYADRYIDSVPGQIPTDADWKRSKKA